MEKMLSQNAQRPWMDTSPKRMRRWSIDIWDDAEHQSSSEMQTKTAVGYTSPLSEWPSSYRQQGRERTWRKRPPLLRAGTGTVHWWAHYRKEYRDSTKKKRKKERKKKKNRTTYNSATPPLGMYQKEIKTLIIFTAALCPMSKCGSSPSAHQ